MHGLDLFAYPERDHGITVRIRSFAAIPCALFPAERDRSQLCADCSISCINLVACGNFPSNGIRQNRRQVIESATSRHSDS